MKEFPLEDILLPFRPVLHTLWKALRVPLDQILLRSIERWRTNHKGLRTERWRALKRSRPVTQGTLRRMPPPKEHLAGPPH